MIFNAIKRVLESSESVRAQIAELLEREMVLHPTEKQVNLLRKHQELQITPNELRDLRKSRGYKRHYGVMPGEHFRRNKGKGSYHLRVKKDGTGHLHWDKYDPRRHPIKHAMEIPAFWGISAGGAAAGALAGGALGALRARKKGLVGRAAFKKAGKWAAIGGVGGLALTAAYGAGGIARRSRKLKALQARDAAREAAREAAKNGKR